MGLLSNQMIAGAAGAAGGGGDFYSHQIANSCRFIGSATNDGTNYMYHTRGTPTNVDKCTISAWVKRSKLGSKDQMFTGSGLYGGNYSWLGFNTANEFYNFQAGSSPRLESNALFRDTSAWMHIVIANDSTQGTAANRNKIYINGVQYTDWGDYATYSTQNTDFYMNTSGYRLFVGSGGASEANSWLPYEGYIAEYCFIDGTQYAASDFGETKNGVWIPKDPSGLTFGNNGAYLKFESSSDLGNDSSGNNNDFTVTGVAAHDQMLDTPTFNSNSNGGNFATLSPLWGQNSSSLKLSEGNLRGTTLLNELGAMSNFEVPDGGKWYWEVNYSDQYSTGSNFLVGIAYANTSLSNTETTEQVVYYSENGMKIIESTRSSYGTAFDSPSGNAVVGVAVDRVNDTLNFSYNGTWQGTFDISGLSNNEFFPYTGSSGYNGQQGWTYNFGQDGTFAGKFTAQGNADDSGYGDFKYPVPSGFLALCSGNLPTADAVDPAQTDDNYPQKLFTSLAYTGGTTGHVTGFKPDLVWVKARSTGQSNGLWDSTRGTTKVLLSNEQNAESTSSGLTAFNTDGYDMGTYYNQGANTYVSWSWRANGGTTSSNATGDITSTVQADPSGGFSIVTYTGSGTAGNTIGHGLSTTPDMIMIKNRSSVDSWAVYSSSLGNTIHLALDTDAAQVTSSAYWNSTSPTSSVFTVGTGDALNQNTKNYVAYCFANIEGYMKFGSYVGNGNADGTFVYTGFRPSMIFVKLVPSAGDWWVEDTARDPYNPAVKYISWDRTDAEASGLDVDFLSNGFKIRTTSGDFNSSGSAILFGAWAKNPFKYATAR